MAAQGAKYGTIRTASTINLLAGIWLFISPWVYGFYSSASAWNCWIVGVLMIIFAGTRLSNPAHVRLLSWFNCILGAWTFASPWIYGYTGDSSRFTNSIVIGVIVFVLAIVSATASTGPLPMPIDQTPHTV